MKEAGASRIVCVMCIMWFLFNVSTVAHTGVITMLPIYVYGSYEEDVIWEEVAQEQVRFFLPVYAYSKKNLVMAKRKDVIPLKNLDAGEMLTLMELENSGLGQEIQKETVVIDELMAEIVSKEQENMAASENDVSMEIFPDSGDMSGTGFVRHEKISPIDLSELTDYETLVKKFYTIDAITNIGGDELNARKLGSVDLTLKQTPDQPQILIYHTHSQEGYADSVPGDDSTTIMGVGEHLKKILETEYGYNVIHHMGKYDVKTRDSAYSRSLPELRRLLEKYPTIEVVIDLHRDAVAEDTRLVMDLDGRPTARFMFFNGISRTTKNGKIDYLYNENLMTNLAFSFQAKWKAEEYYPGLTRRNYLNAYRYNMHVCPKTMLLELGAQNNTLEEAMNACDPIAHILHMVLSGEEAS